MKDIRVYKANLRQRYRGYREGLDPVEKDELDRSIFERIIRLRQFHEAPLLLTYVSTPIEVDTRRLIEYAVAQGKQVAVPRCVPDSRQMEFYRIDSISMLKPGTFGVLEPAPDPERLVTPGPGSLCVVPGLCFDEYGYRLGYGKGYYDRFLSAYAGVAVGICYAKCLRGRLFHGRYDRPVELLVTERSVRRLNLLANRKEKGER